MNLVLQEYIIEIIKQHWSIDITDIQFETPPKKEMGDFAFACFILARELKKSPIQIAGELSDIIKNDKNSKKIISHAEAVGPYLNVFLSDESLLQDFQKFLRHDLFGLTPQNKDTTIYIDYIGANVGKPLHIGHMCTPLHGQVFVNLFRKLGYNVISDSHIGDWGIIFGKLIVAYQKYGNKVELEKNAVEHLFQLYVKISNDSEENTSLDQDFRDAFYKLSHGDKESIILWTSFTKSSISVMNSVLSRIFVFPQYNIGESFYEGLGLPKMEEYPDLEYSMSDIVQELIHKGIATRNEDTSVGIVFPDEMKIPSCILQKRDGTHGYLASDLASVKYRVTHWNIKKILYFVDVRQQLHFKQVEAISRMASWIDDSIEFTHAYNGFVSLKDGAMSTRKGKIIKLEALLDESEKRAEKIIQEKRDDISAEELSGLSKIIGIGAIKYGYLKKSRENDVIFDWDEFMSFEGNSGPYIQYAYVRAKKIVERYGKTTHKENLEYTQKEEKELIKHMLDFQNMIENMSREYQSHILCSYVYELTKRFSAFYNSVQIFADGIDLNIQNSRIVLLESFLHIMSESFSILAIPLPNEM